MKKETRPLAKIPFCLPEGAIFAVLDINPTTRYYRTSLLSKVFLIKGGPLQKDPVTETIYTLERESDDYDILMELAGMLADVSLLVTYNGTSFDIPHIRKKCEAYRIPDFLDGKRHEDLMLTLRPCSRLFSLKTRRLSDYVSLLPSREGLTDDAVLALAATSLRAFSFLIKGGFNVSRACQEEGKAVFFLAPKLPLPCAISFSCGSLALAAGPDETRLTSELFDGALRRYYRDFKNYRFLPLEGYAVHQSVARYVGSDRKEKATRDNCFTYVKCSERFLSNPEATKSYALSSLIWLAQA